MTPLVCRQLLLLSSLESCTRDVLVSPRDFDLGSWVAETLRFCVRVCKATVLRVFQVLFVVAFLYLARFPLYLVQQTDNFKIVFRDTRHNRGHEQMRANASKCRETLANACKRRRGTQADVSKRGRTQTNAYTINQPLLADDDVGPVSGLRSRLLAISKPALAL